MEPSDCKAASLASTTNQQPDSLFERWAWFYSLCREYLFRDHTPEIAHSLFPPSGPAPGTHVLELGCGPGFYACKFAQEYPQITTTGIDLSERLIERAKSRAASRALRNCNFRHGDAQALPELPGPIDAIIVSRLFLIVPDKEAVLAEILRVLRPGGRCFIAEPTSGFRTRLPLSCMWLLARLTSSPAGKYREPQQADVMSRPAFAALIRSQPWGEVQLEYDGWYQYAVCTKAPTPSTAPSPSTHPTNSVILSEPKGRVEGPAAALHHTASPFVTQQNSVILSEGAHGTIVSAAVEGPAVALACSPSRRR